MGEGDYSLSSDLVFANWCLSKFGFISTESRREESLALDDYISKSWLPEKEFTMTSFLKEMICIQVKGLVWVNEFHFSSESYRTFLPCFAAVYHFVFVRKKII